MSETMLYRASDTPNPDVWGLNVEHAVFDDAEVDEAVAEGWCRHPFDIAYPDAANIAKAAAMMDMAKRNLDEDGAEDLKDFVRKRRGRPPKEG